jgi:hypothetical protein
MVALGLERTGHAAQSLAPRAAEPRLADGLAAG